MNANAETCKYLIDRLKSYGEVCQRAASVSLVRDGDNETQAKSFLSKEEWHELYAGSQSREVRDFLFQKAREVRERYFGRKIYIRGLIEFTNYCKNNCYYCGIRQDNRAASRYRLDKSQILACCESGYRLGFRTFVLQGGEDGYFTRERMVDLIGAVKEHFPDCALTLSVGEKSKEDYEAFYRAGADRYLLRHETADALHYRKLHPEELSLENRMKCLRTLKEIGYQTGAGFMVGSPGQTEDTLFSDLEFLAGLRPQMVGIGPFIPHSQTPFAGEKAGTVEQTLFFLAVIRLLLPSVLLPATTALGTLDLKGREKGMAAGANVVMPNLSPIDVRGKYLLYNNKISTGEEAAESLELLKKSMSEIGYEVVVDRGDAPDL